ncbi:MAG: universal stress protein [Gemmatimonadales bacterium]|nr:MAG: universal stress protein [Gemmatimonadales bacterium]
MKILLATDGSRYAGEAVRLLGSLGPHRSFLVDLVAVVPGPASIESASAAREATDAAADSGSDAGSGLALMLPRIEDRVPVDVAEAWLAEAAAELESAGIEVQTHIVHGVPETALVERCREGGHDLIVAGVKGRGAAPFFEVGRVARHLVRWAPISVLLVRERAARARGAAATAQGESEGFRVLVPTDGNAGSLEASWRMLESLTPSDAGVEIVRVVEPSQARTPTPAGEATWTAGSAETRESVRRWASPEPAASGRRAPRPESTILRGRPAAAIARWASWNHSDLVVLGLRKPDGTGPCLLGKTARELTWSSPCSILMVRN